MQKIKSILLVTAVTLLLFTRFVNLGWGLPYPMHPDERNMAVAIQGLACHVAWPVSASRVKECLNPHFFAYGQLPLYLSYAGIGLMHLFSPAGAPASFDEAVMALRIISAIASVLTAAVLMNILFLYVPRKRFAFHFTSFLLIIFSPYFIQFSHFGTTESLLMLCYSTLLYLCLRAIRAKTVSKRQIIALGIVAGVASAVKVSSLLFWFLPAGILAVTAFPNRKLIGTRMIRLCLSLCLLGGTAGLVTLLLSPQNVISLPDFLGALSYESSVAMGTYIAFYTKQFVGTVPVLYQLQFIFPYVLGWPVFLVFAGSFFLLPWDRKHNILRFAFLLYFIPSSATFAKWTRFMAPILPLATVMALLFAYHAATYILKHFSRMGKAAVVLAALLAILPGIAFLSVYTEKDVRFRASEWIYANIEEGQAILSETANVIDIPVPSSSITTRIPQYQYTSFNFYEVDQNPALQDRLAQEIGIAGYIFVPSRRVFANLTCVASKGELILPPASCERATEYPILDTYYRRLLDGSFGFSLKHTETAYPRLSLFGKTIVSFPDESAEETWTVFDHPVIRIYGRSKKNNVRVQGDVPLDFSSYPLVSVRINGVSKKLLVADSPERWSQGLMYARSLEGADGMLFVFPESSPLSFWNKNTVSDLTLYWMRGDTIVGTADMKSIEKTKEVVSFSSPSPVDRVAEILK